VDAEGYGYEPGDRSIRRLLGDFRTLSPAGIERAAWGWDKHVGSSGRQHFRAAEEVALRAIEQSGRSSQWGVARRAIYGLTEGDNRLIDWAAEHGEVSHKSEHAAYGAALGLLAGDEIDEQSRHILLRPLAEALPWLLPEAPPTPH
jgi:hypothetical protein